MLTDRSRLALGAGHLLVAARELGFALGERPLTKLDLLSLLVELRASGIDRLPPVSELPRQVVDLRLLRGHLLLAQRELLLGLGELLGTAIQLGPFVRPVGDLALHGREPVALGFQGTQLPPEPSLMELELSPLAVELALALADRDRALAEPFLPRLKFVGGIDGRVPPFLCSFDDPLCHAARLATLPLNALWIPSVERLKSIDLGGAMLCG
jgi:hypothetical protein